MKRYGASCTQILMCRPSSPLDSVVVFGSNNPRSSSNAFPQVGYFGMSASTGDLSDRHEVVSFRATPFAGDDKENSAHTAHGGGGELAEGADDVKAAADAAGIAAVAAAQEAEEAAQAASEAQRMVDEAQAQAQHEQREQRHEERQGSARAGGGAGRSKLDIDREARRFAAERRAEAVSAAAAARAEEAARSAEAAKAKAVETAREVRESMKMKQSKRFVDVHRQATSEATNKKEGAEKKSSDSEVTDDAGVDGNYTGDDGRGLWWCLKVLAVVGAAGAVGYYALEMRRRQDAPLLPVSGRKYN